MTASLGSFAVIVSAAALTAAVTGASQGTILSDAAPPGPRTGLIVGQVIDAVTGDPIPEAIVNMSMPSYRASLPTTPKGRVMADDEGRYFFADLPAGDYFIRATKEGYTGGGYGQRRPAAITQLATLGEGERRTDATLRLWKSGAISGTVIDEAGEPVVGATVNALSRDFVSGHPRYGKAVSQPWAIPAAITDDRGVFRISGLPPADYAVVVPAMQTTVPVSVLNSFPQNAMLRSNLMMAMKPLGSSDVNAIYEQFPLGQSRAQQTGDFALVTLNGAPLPPPVSATGRLEVYPTTYFPAAATVASASLITVRAGEERGDVSVRLQPVLTTRVSGRITTPAGNAPSPLPIRLVGASAADVADEGFETAVGMTDTTGRFTLLGVPPGEYRLKTSDRFLALNARNGQPALFVNQPVSVGEKDIEDLAVVLRPAVRVEARNEFRGPAPTGPGAQLPRVLQFETPSGERGFAIELINGVFSTVALPGRYIARPMETGGLVVESVMIGGKNITDSAFDLSEDASIVVTYTDRRSRVAGTVKDARGEASAIAAVLAFPVELSKWSNYGANPRTLRVAQASRSGAYAFEHLPAGEYYLIAIDSADAENWTDPKRLEAFARHASKVTVTSTETKAIDLTLKAVR